MTGDKHKQPAGRIDPVVDWVQQVQFSDRTRVTHPPAWRDRRAWRWVAALLLVLALVVVIFRVPLANLIWPDMRVQRLLDEAGQALAQGRLSADDGTGARQRFEAAQALDTDRSEASEGLAKVAAAALARAHAQGQANQFEQARQSLALARELQVPRAAADAVAEALRERESSHAGVEDLVAQAETARVAGELESALSLYQRVLLLQPSHTAALEGREDALADLLQVAKESLERGDLARGNAMVAQARQFDAGHPDLPELQARMARTVESHRARADQALRRGRLEDALAGYRRILAASPQDAAATQGVERVSAAYAQRAAAQAADFDFDAAQASLRSARELMPRSAEVVDAEQALLRARQSQSRLASSLPVAERQRRVRALLDAMQQAEARGEWLTPPGESAYDKLRAAQALAPDAAEVRRAAARLVPATQACFEDEMRANRIRRARNCYDAWQALSPADARLQESRRRLSLKWIAVGDEQLGSGRVEFAAQALQEASGLDPEAPGLAEFAARVRNAQAGSN